jgi:PqqD family protein of HPr-rel-A system
MSLQTWQALNPTDLVCRRWPGEDEGVVFNASSGDLHLLNAAAFDLLQQLLQTPASVDELASSFDLPRDVILGILDSFDSLGLVAGP